MRYQVFLLNEDRSVSISEDKAFADIKKYCSQSYKAYMNEKIIYRGITKNKNAFYVDPSKGSPRQSANTDNYYTLLIDNSPYWKNFPKRSESLIMTNSYKSASIYGTVYEVFLYDNPTIGIAPKHDMWFSFTKTLGAANSLDYFNFVLKKLFTQYGINLNNRTFGPFKRSLSELEQELKNDRDNLSSMNLLTKKWRIDKESFLDNLNNLIIPNANRFKVINDANHSPKKSHGLGQEIWSDSKAIVIISMYGGASGKNTELIDYMENK